MQFKDAFAEALAPEQCAVGLPGGAEVAHKTLSVFSECHPSHVFFKLDARNAYCELFRESSVNAASSAFPSLAGLWSLFYCRGTVHSRYLFRQGGEAFTILSDAGVDQGDSLAPVLFSFGVQPAARALLSELRARASQVPGDSEVLVLLYLDDVYVVVSQALAADVFPLAVAAFGSGLPGVPGCGLTLRLDKCAAWCPAGVKPTGLPSELTWQDEALVVLGSSLLEPDSVLEDFLRAGVPVSPTFGQSSHWETCVGAALTLGDRVLDLYRRRSDVGDAQGESVLNAVQCCQLLLRSCVEPKLLHLLRAYSSSALGPRPALTNHRLQDF